MDLRNLIILAAALCVSSGAAADRGLGPVKLIECRMDECSWSRLVSNTHVVKKGDEQLRKYVTMDGHSAHPDDIYPTRYSERVRIDWERRPVTTYVLCSRRRPAIAFQDRSDSRKKGRWYAHYLDLFSLFGYNRSSAVIYADACHKLAFNFGDAEKTLRRLGYRPGTRNEQVDLRGPMDLLKR